MESYSVESCVRGYHVYKDVWEASVGEDLSCQRESGNSADPFAVAVVKNDMTVGHVPRRISSVSSLFLRKGGVIKVRIIEIRRYSTDLPQGGPEIPCLLTFKGAGKDIQKVRKLVGAALTPPVTAKSITCDLSPDKKRRKVDPVNNSYSNPANVQDMKEWVRCGQFFLTNFDRQIDSLTNMSTLPKHC